MEVYFVLKNPKPFGEEDSFYSPQRKLAVWGKTEIPDWTRNSRLNSWFKLGQNRKYKKIVLQLFG
jgi:hypothetical protein